MLCTVIAAVGFVAAYILTVPLPERATGAKFPLAASVAPNTTSGTWLAVTPEQAIEAA